MKKLLISLLLVLVLGSLKCEVDEGWDGWDKGENGGYTPRDAKL